MAEAPYVSQRLVTVFGGSGFIGRHVVRALVKRGWRVRVAVRRPDLANFLSPLGDVGQIHAVQANMRYPASIASALVSGKNGATTTGSSKLAGGSHHLSASSKTRRTAKLIAA